MGGLATADQAVRIFKNRVFIVAISLGFPCPPTVKFEAEKTRVKQVREAFEDNGGKFGKDSIPLFEVLDKDGKILFSSGRAHTKASTAIDALQERHMINGSKKEWYVPESNIDRLDADIKNEAEALISNLLEEFEAYHDDAKGLYFERLHNVLEAADLLALEAEYQAKFPSMDEIRASFVLSIDRWEPQPSLEEIMERAELDSALKRQAEVLEAQIKALQSKAPKIQDEVFGCFARVLNDLENYWGSDVKPNRRRRIAEAIDRISTLLSFWESSFSSPNTELEGRLKSIAHLAGITTAESDDALDSKTHKDKIKDKSEVADERIWALRNKWRENLTLLPTGVGSKALHQWMYPETNLEAQITEMQAKVDSGLDSEGQPLTEAAIARTTSKLNSLKDVLRYKLERLIGKEPEEDADIEYPDESDLTEVVDEDDDVADCGF